ncbi:MAG: mechanosensitive ion channel family protein [Thioalkalivibrio sp.]|nr:MAG: mechanosensitive ion channel family protein [Thioalkalivibrio sp.]
MAADPGQFAQHALSQRTFRAFSISLVSSMGHCHPGKIAGQGVTAGTGRRRALFRLRSPVSLFILNRFSFAVALGAASGPKGCCSLNPLRQVPWLDFPGTSAFWPTRRWRRIMYRWLGVLFLTAMTGMMSAQAPAENDFAVVASVAGLEENIEHLEAMRAAADAAQEWDRDGFHFRLDQLMLAALARAETVSLEASGTGEGDEIPVVRERVSDATSWLLETSISRLEEIYSRISHERLKYDEFDSGLQASVSAAFVQDLQTLIFEYMSGLGALLRVREQLGLSVEDDRDAFEEFITRNVERLHGQIRLDAQTLTELRRTLRSDPSNEDIELALRAVDRKQSRNLANMAAWLDVLPDHGVDAAGHRALLIQQQGRLGAEILRRDVFASIWREQTDRLWRNVSRNGPTLLLRVFTFLAVLVLAWMAAHVIRRLLETVMNSAFVRLSQLMKERLLTLSFGITFLAGAVLALAAIGWSVMPMLAGLGVAGIIIGFALQDSLKSFVAGWMILLYHAYDVGDYVQVSGAEGRVRRMTLNSTRIATPDNTIKLVPNRKIWDETIVNLTASRARRLGLEISCAPDNDMDRVERSIREFLAKHPQILNKPQPEVYLARIGSSEMVFAVQPWVRTEHYWSLQRSLLKEIRQRLERDGIS